MFCQLAGEWHISRYIFGNNFKITSKIFDIIANFSLQDNIIFYQEKGNCYLKHRPINFQKQYYYIKHYNLWHKYQNSNLMYQLHYFKDKIFYGKYNCNNDLYFGIYNFKNIHNGIFINQFWTKGTYKKYIIVNIFKKLC